MNKLKSSLAGIAVSSCILYSVLNSLHVYADEFSFTETQQFLSELHNPSHLLGQFIQQKNLHELPFPLVSNGNFEFSKADGLHWQTLAPIPNDLWLTSNYILQQQDGEQVFRIDIAEQPIAQLVSKIFFAVLSGDWNQLESHFNISLLSKSNKKNEWSIELTPKSLAIKNFTSLINVEGDTYIKLLVLTEPNGDKTTISFRNISEDQ